MAEIAYSRRVGSKRIGTGGVRRVGPYTVDVAPDLVFPQWFEVSGLHLEAYPGLTFGVRATWNAEKLAFDLRQLSLESDSGIEGEQLRELSRNEILRGTQVLLAHVHVDDGSTAPLVWEAEGIARAVEAGPTPETLVLVSRQYAMARAIGAAPNKAVMTAFNLPQRTATRWIARARSEGHLE